ncbi:BTB/POZ domain-containing protein 2-like [Sitodiplosis mosellana]|uniref:BTB/POZ domain-containing protein 2-like n=1 Tax=Sitodiplosis mosellana TaxID=263140 RepID=UPI0024440C44|nr:BTB/POZ domain-containing protein 2-like [Sitodiplosis mosellana]
MYLNERLADVYFEFKVDDETQKVPANKSVLAALSPVFDTMFIGSLPEKGDVSIPDANADAFKEFLQLFYLGEVTLTMENIETVVRLADKYDVVERVNACIVFLKGQLTLDISIIYIMCWGYQLAVNLKNAELIEYFEEKIIKSPKEVFASEVFKRCDKSILKRIFELDLICKETDVFDACLKWAKYACEQNDLDGTQAVNLRTQLGNCLKLIQFGLMKIEEFNKRYRKTSGKLEMPIRTQEVTSFASNNHLLLGEIQAARTYIGSSEIVGTEVEVTITECGNPAFASIESSKILYEGTSSTWYGDDQLKVTLPQPILIKPQRMYEVRLVVRSPNGYTYFPDCQPMVEMKDGTKIQLYRNPTLDYDNLANGWISNLIFNKI